MKSSLLHLPAKKIKEIEKVVEIITDLAAVEKVILFGSHARGDWVSDKYKDGYVTYEYQSDFDILVIVNSEKNKNDIFLWDKIKQQILNDPEILTTVNLIVDTAHFVNEKIAEGNYFYSDIKSEGISLYDSGSFQLAESVMLSVNERKELVKSEYEFWLGKAKSFIKDFKHNIADEELNNAAFHLSQAVESLYFAVLLVFSGYKPKSHNLEKIESLVFGLVPEVKNIFPKITEEQRALYSVLVRSYIDARYNKEFVVSKEELEKLFEETEKLMRLVIRSCETKIENLK
ncbi:HEPN domain-containing protein [candidate division WWE3 bacterium]|uniref:HEPN domain-containing protein n=1 Tax=candidate division WWE3 bacterium TaxID=2053526 RepID=A0A7X9DKW4_UNCKA|nr:HEPN domain-containing protein [candidate division WWE3 bacterium]